MTAPESNVANSASMASSGSATVTLPFGYSKLLLRIGDAEGQVSHQPLIGQRMHRRGDMGAPQLGGAHLSALIEFGHVLNVTQDDGERLRRLCRLFTSGDYHGRCAMVLRVWRSDPEKPQVISGPENGPGWH